MQACAALPAARGLAGMSSRAKQDSAGSVLREAPPKAPGLLGCCPRPSALQMTPSQVPGSGRCLLPHCAEDPRCRGWGQRAGTGGHAQPWPHSLEASLVPRLRFDAGHWDARVGPAGQAQTLPLLQSAEPEVGPEFRGSRMGPGCRFPGSPPS